MTYDAVTEILRRVRAMEFTADEAKIIARAVRLRVRRTATDDEHHAKGIKR